MFQWISESQYVTLVQYKAPEVDILVLKVQQAPKVHISVLKVQQAPKGPHFGTQSPTFRVQSVKVKDGYIDDMFSLWDSNKLEINLFIEHANSSHPTFIFTAEISVNKTTFLNTAN